jgi:Ca2+:H+ antiporter
VARKLLWGSLVLAPATIVVDYVFHAGDVPLFVLAAASLVPLAWLIGEATEHASEHTGPGIGGFLNASFGNAPELIIALVAVGSGLPNVVRASLAGSVISNLLLVLGLAMTLAGDAEFDRRSLLGQLALVALAVLAFLVPAVPGFHGDPDRHSLALVTIPVAVALLGVYLALTTLNLRRHRAQHQAEEPPEHAWSLPLSIATLAGATAMTAVVSEILVHSLEGFARVAGLSEFFIAAVIVAIVGNAAEHGGALVIAQRGNMALASEIAVSSAAQVGVFLIPAVALLSFAVEPALPLTFRPIELAGMGGAVAAVALAVRDGRSRRRDGGALVAAYCAFAVWVFLAGDR